MKITFSILISFFAFSEIKAFEPIARIASTNDLELLVFGENGERFCRADERIVYVLRSRTDDWLILVPKPEYLCTVQLTGTNGARLHTTPIGRTTGAKFGQIAGYDRSLISRVESHPNELQRMHVRTTNGSGGNFLFRPNELFHPKRGRLYASVANPSFWKTRQFY